MHHLRVAVATGHNIVLVCGDLDMCRAGCFIGADGMRWQEGIAPLHLDNVAHGDVRVGRNNHRHTLGCPNRIHAVNDDVARQLHDVQFCMSGQMGFIVFAARQIQLHQYSQGRGGLVGDGAACAGQYVVDLVDPAGKDVRHRQEEKHRLVAAVFVILQHPGKDLVVLAPIDIERVTFAHGFGVGIDGAEQTVGKLVVGFAVDTAVPIDDRLYHGENPQGTQFQPRNFSLQAWKQEGVKVRHDEKPQRRTCGSARKALINWA